MNQFYFKSIVKKLDAIALPDAQSIQRTARVHHQSTNGLFLKDDVVVLKTSESENNLLNLQPDLSRQKVPNQFLQESLLPYSDTAKNLSNSQEQLGSSFFGAQLKIKSKNQVIRMNVISKDFQQIQKFPQLARKNYRNSSLVEFPKKDLLTPVMSQRQVQPNYRSKNLSSQQLTVNREITMNPYLNQIMRPKMPALKLKNNDSQIQQVELYEQLQLVTKKRKSLQELLIDLDGESSLNKQERFVHEIGLQSLISSRPQNQHKPMKKQEVQIIENTYKTKNVSANFSDIKTPEQSISRKKQINADIINQLKSTSALAPSKKKQLSQQTSQSSRFQQIQADSFIKETNINPVTERKNLPRISSRLQFQKVESVTDTQNSNNASTIFPLLKQKNAQIQIQRSFQKSLEPLISIPEQTDSRREQRISERQKFERLMYRNSRKEIESLEKMDLKLTEVGKLRKKKNGLFRGSLQVQFDIQN